eukprot:6190893-Pleurochrysis_carterae.AAC.4
MSAGRVDRACRARGLQARPRPSRTDRARRGLFSAGAVAAHAPSPARVRLRGQKRQVRQRVAAVRLRLDDQEAREGPAHERRVEKVVSPDQTQKQTKSRRCMKIPKDGVMGITRVAWHEARL